MNQAEDGDAPARPSRTTRPARNGGAKRRAVGVAMSRLGRALAAVIAVVAIASACAASPSARLSKDLIPVPALQAPPWGLRIASSGRTLNPFGVAPAGGSLSTNIARAKTVATRQWVRGPRALAAGPLPDGVTSVIDTAAHFASTAEAQAFVADLSNGYGSGTSRSVPGSPGAVMLTAPFTAAVPGGRLTGNQELVVIARGAHVFTVLLVGGGSRPTPADAEALARLQAGAIPPSVE